MKAKIIFSFCLVLSLGSSVSAQDLLPDDNGIFNYHRAPDYRESESHPLRTVAYVLHPVGWVLREAFYRPWSAFAASSEFTRSFFGYRDPYSFRADKLCFHNGEEVPDCASVAPYNSIGSSSVEDGSTDGESAERQVYFPDVNFEYDQAELTALGKGRVRQAAQLLASVPNVNIVVEGHTDDRGTDEYNMSLGSRRAESVVKELTELGIDPGRISPVSYGESRPVFAEGEEWAWAVNRRVQFSVQGEAAPAPEVAAAQ